MATDRPEDTLNFVDGNHVFIHGVFDESISKHVLPSLVKLVEIQGKVKNGKIKFYINSDGGLVFSLLDLLAQIEMAKKMGVIVETYVYGRAYSCGSLLACSGSPGHRYISGQAEHLCHLGSAGTGVVCNDVELKRSHERAQYHFDRIRKLYKKYARIKDLDKAIKYDNYFIRGKEIIANGLADKIIDE